MSDTAEIESLLSEVTRERDGLREAIARADSKSKNAELKRGIIGLRDCWNKMEAEGNPNNAPPPGPSFYAQCVDEMLAELKERPE
jgi:hypothetical protein